MANHRAPTTPRRRPDTANPTLALVALLLGAFGIAGAWLPYEMITGPAAVIGLVVGSAGIWWSRQVASGVGVFLCGIALVLTALFHVGIARADTPAPAEPVIVELNGDCP